MYILHLIHTHKHAHILSLSACATKVVTKQNPLLKLSKKKYSLNLMHTHKQTFCRCDARTTRSLDFQYTFLSLMPTHMHMHKHTLYRREVTTTCSLNFRSMLAQINAHTHIHTLCRCEVTTTCSLYFQKYVPSK